MPLDVRSGPWDAEAIRAYLEDATIPVRLATQGQYPLVQSLWFAYGEDALWCATQADSVLVERLQRDDRCGFEVAADAPPYRGVRGTGRARIEPGRAEEVLHRLIARYVGHEPSPLADWLLSRTDTEVAIRLDIARVSSWDYTSRMSSQA